MKPKPRLVGINKVALQVDDIDQAVAFYTGLFQPTAVDRSVPHAAFLEMGDQFRPCSNVVPRAEEPHFGLVVDDREAAGNALGGRRRGGARSALDLRDPSGNRIQIVQYDEIQFTKTDRVLTDDESQARKVRIWRSTSCEPRTSRISSGEPPALRPSISRSVVTFIRLSCDCRLGFPVARPVITDDNDNQGENGQ